nr:CHAD domain-containing protein [Saprospiraceae bacterium]
MEDRSAKTVAERWSVLVQSTLQEIQFYLRDLHDELPMKTVHQLRLALKRLRVLLAVLEQTRDGLKQVITLQKSVNKLFEVAGILRDAQVRRGL